MASSLTGLFCIVHTHTHTVEYTRSPSIIFQVLQLMTEGRGVKTGSLSVFEYRYLFLRAQVMPGV